MRIYKSISFILIVLFAATGIIFLAIPDRVLILFNTLSAFLGMQSSPVYGWNFFLILAAGYMYLVTILAFLMLKDPDNQYFPLLLIHAKLASSILSLAFFMLQAHYLIYLANFIVDGVIGVVVLALYVMMRKTEWAYS
jgi:hypothetical protein